MQIAAAPGPDGRRGDIYHFAVAALDHERHHSATAKEHSSQVHVDDLPPLVEADLGEGLERERREDGRVIDKRERRAVVALHIGRHPCDGPLVGNVEDDGGGTPAAGADLGSDRSRSIWPHVGNDDVRASARDSVCKCTPEALSSAGDDDWLSRESHVRDVSRVSGAKSSSGSSCRGLSPCSYE